MSPVRWGLERQDRSGKPGSLWFHDTQHHASVTPLEEWKLSFPWGDYENCKVLDEQKHTL